jgi:transposase
MAKKLLTDELWTRIAPLIPPDPPKPKGGRPRIGARACLLGILFVLKTGIPWGDLPAELGCGSGVTCWRRLREWQAAGVWDRLLRVLLDDLGAAGDLDWTRAVVDAGTVPAPGGAPKPARTPPIGANWAASAT